jgi:hypothetical protein
MTDSTKDPKKTKESKESKDTAPKEKGKGPLITDKVHVDYEPSTVKLGLGINELFDAIINGDDATALNEVLSVAARIKKRQQIRRYKSRMQIARKRSLRRRASNAVIGRRARRSAVTAVKTKLAGGRSMQSLTYSERSRVEKLAARRKGVIQRRARKLIITKRQTDRQRIANRGRR